MTNNYIGRINPDRFKHRGYTALNRGAITPFGASILAMLAQGMSCKEIENDTGMSHTTLRWHIRRMFLFYGAQNAVHLVAKAIFAGALSQEMVNNAKSADCEAAH